MAPISSLAQHVLEAQSLRATAYSMLLAAQRSSLRYSRDDQNNESLRQSNSLYASVISQVTGMFQQASEQVRACEKEAMDEPRDEARDTFSALLRRLQEAEREKLELTLSLHALQRSSLPEEHGVGDMACSACCGSGPCAADIKEALSECTKKLEDVIVRINEEIEELRYFCYAL